MTAETVGEFETNDPTAGENQLMSIESVRSVLAAPINLNHPGHYLHWGFIQISVANLVLIILMVLIFVAALLLPFPKDRDKS